MKNFHLLDICPSDYFSGHHLPVIGVFWDGEELTVSEVMERIENEYNACFDLYEQYDPFFDEAKKNFLGDDPDKTYLLANVDLLEQDDDEKDMQMYFVLGELQIDSLGFRYVV